MQGNTSTFRLGVDIGGTFTDIVLIEDDGTIFSKKVLSTPHDYSEAIQTGITALLDELDLAPGRIREFAHATTVATNAIIERKGVLVALVTTKGFRDVLELGRYRTPKLYDITFRKPAPLVDRRLRFEVTERTAADGSILQGINEDELADIAEKIRQSGALAVAVCMLNSYANPANEIAVTEYLTKHLPNVSVTSSTQLLPQIGEYERTSTTVVNAYIRPVVERYVASLEKRLEAIRIDAPLTIMQSSGGMSPGDVVAKKPIYIIESGPAAGVLGSQKLAETRNIGDVIVFDMGGTTAKATIITENQFALCPETEVGGGAALGQRMVKGGGFAVQVPTIDIAEVGAGGGSIAAIDAAGGIQVGPRSAGAAPGPICYNRGGTQPTVTDANLILGYLNPNALVGGELSLAYDAAKAALSELGSRLGVSTEEAAYGVHLIANSTMLRALQGVSSEKGMDPANFGLFAIGGNGPVHASTLAEAAGMKRIVVPPVAGLFSALGMLFADVEHQLVGAFYKKFSDVGLDDLRAASAHLIEQGTELLKSEGYTEERERQIDLYADVKYAGQTSALSIPLPGDWGKDFFETVLQRFEAEHLRTFGYTTDGEQLQFVSIKAVCRGLASTPRMPDSLQRRLEKSAGGTSRVAYFGPEHGWATTQVVRRSQVSDTPMQGPVIVEEYDTTTVVRPGWTVRRDAANVLVIEKSV